jgi:flavin-dependent dehydrogenase
MEANRTVAIVGASLAGLYAARELARAGRKVYLFEAEPEPRFAPRTLIVTAELPRLLGFDPAPAVLNRIRVFELFSRGASARIALLEPDLVVERSRLLELLLRDATACGARMQFASPLRDLLQEGKDALLSVEGPGGRLELPVTTLLGADGIGSVVADHLGCNRHRRVAILQARVPRPADCPPDTVRVWFDRASTRFFYWLIPEGEEFAAFGLIADTPAQAKAALEAALRAQALEPLEYQGALVPLHPHPGHPWIRRGQAEIYLAGDAAGQVKATTVGGVVAGLRGARAAVHAILHRDGQAAWRGLKRELALHRLLRAVLDRFTDADYDALLTHLNGRGREILAAHNRDHLLCLLWKLPAAQARWAGLALRAIVRSGGSRLPRFLFAL